MSARREKLFVLLTVLVLFLFIACTLLNVLDTHSLQSRLEKVRDELTVSVGREAKQQAEYDEVSAELPVVEESILDVSPRAEKAESAVKELKDVRKQLRQEKKRLQKLLSQAGETEEQADDQ